MALGEAHQCLFPLSPALRMAFLLLLLISATWMLGLMAVNSDVMTFHYLFAVFSCLQVTQRVIFVYLDQRPSRCPVYNASLLLSSQGVFIFFFHVIFNKEVRKNLKNVFTGKKSLPDESSTTRASLLTVSKQTLILFLPLLHYHISNLSF